MGDNFSDGQRAAAGQVSAGALMRQPWVGAAAVAIVSLGLGVVIGRATVSTTASSETNRAQPALRPVRDKESVADVPKRAREELPAGEYRLHVGRHIPTGKQGGGFEHQRIAGRHVARLTNESLVRFDLEPSSASYALLAVLGLENGQGTVTPTLDGQSLGSWSVTPGWNAFYAAVPSQLLRQRLHELALRQTVTGEGPINADAVAVIPVGNDVHFTMGMESVGHLVDGFGNRSGRSVWSFGPRSVVGVALAPAAGAYRLSVHGAALPALAPLAVNCKINGEDVGTAQFDRKATESSWTVPANVLRSGLNRIEFLYARTAIPAELDPQSKDRRPLALRFAELKLTPHDVTSSEAAR